MKSKKWSMEDSHLNENNIIFRKDEKIHKRPREINQSLGYYILDQEDKWVKVEKIEIKEQ